MLSHGDCNAVDEALSSMNRNELIRRLKSFRFSVFLTLFKSLFEAFASPPFIDAFVDDSLELANFSLVF